MSFKNILLTVGFEPWISRFMTSASRFHLFFFLILCNYLGAVSIVIRKMVNANIPYVPWLTGYLAIAVGGGVTMMIQSSSVFTSALTPLAGKVTK